MAWDGLTTAPSGSGHNGSWQIRRPQKVQQEVSQVPHSHPPPEALSRLNSGDMRAMPWEYRTSSLQTVDPPPPPAAAAIANIPATESPASEQFIKGMILTLNSSIQEEFKQLTKGLKETQMEHEDRITR